MRAVPLSAQVEPGTARPFSIEAVLTAIVAILCVRLRHALTVCWGLALCVLCWSLPARAADFAQALSALGQDDSDAMQAAIVDLGASDDPRALAALTALADGKLFVDESKGLFIKKDETFVDAKSGQPATPSGNATALRANNQLRRVLGPTLAQLVVGA